MTQHRLNDELLQMLFEKGLSYDIETLTVFFESLDLPFGYERDIKSYIKKELDRAGIPYEINVRVGKKTHASFLIAGCVALFLSVESTVKNIYHQLEGFAKSRWVDSIILVTSRNIQLAETIAGKPMVIIRPVRTMCLRP